jgi:hypothetical protein
MEEDEVEKAALAAINAIASAIDRLAKAIERQVVVSEKAVNQQAVQGQQFLETFKKL